MRGMWAVFYGLIAVVGALVGSAIAQQDGTAAQAAIGAMPVPSSRELVYQYAIWVLVVLGFAYLTYVGVREQRRGLITQILLRAGTVGRFATRELVGHVARMMCLALVVSAAAVGAYFARGGRQLGVWEPSYPEIAAWLMELAIATVVLLAVGWRVPNGPGGIVALVCLLPLSMVKLPQSAHLVALALLAAAALSGLVFVIRKTDWTRS